MNPGEVKLMLYLCSWWLQLVPLVVFHFLLLLLFFEEWLISNTNSCILSVSGPHV